MDIRLDNIDSEKIESFFEIFKNEDVLNSRSDEKKIVFTTDCWLAQLGSRKN